MVFEVHVMMDCATRSRRTDSVLRFSSGNRRQHRRGRLTGAGIQSFFTVLVGVPGWFCSVCATTHPELDGSNFTELFGWF